MAVKTSGVSDSLASYSSSVVFVAPEVVGVAMGGARPTAPGRGNPG